MELHPIIIPPLETKRSSLAFTCSGGGLQVFGNVFDPKVASNLPLLTPKLTAKGTIAVHQPRIQKQHSDYWKAQCVFRGLPHSGRTVKALQDSLRDPTKKEMVAELAELEKRMNEEFLTKNAAARDEQWKTLDTLGKAEKDPKRFLEETFPPGERKTNAIILKTHSRQALHIAAEKLGLSTKSTDAPKSAGCRLGPTRWIVIGQNQRDVAAKIQEIDREALRAKLQLQEAQDEAIEEAHAKIISQLRRGEGWDVTGSWHIKCPKIEQDYDIENIYLDIYRKNVNGHLQMYGRFHFGIVKGVLRFEKPGTAVAGMGGSAAKTSAGNGSWDGDNYEGSEVEEDGDDEDDDDDDDDKVDNEDFHLTSTDKPSPQHSTWNFRWRGQETGEGEIQLYSDQKLCSITFSGPGGCKLNGVFRNRYVSNCTFSGVKVDTQPRTGHLYIEERWSDYNAEAYEKARVGRWH